MNNHVSFELAKLLKEKKFHKSLPSICFIKEESNYTSTMVYEVFDVDFEYILRPTIAEVVMWLYKKHGIWIEVKSPDYSKELWSFAIHKPYKFGSYGDGTGYNSPTEAYEAAIKHILIRLL